MAVSAFAGPALVRVDFAKPQSLSRRVGRLPRPTCGRKALVPSAIQADPTPSSSNGKVPEAQDRDQEDLLAPVGLLTSNLFRANRAPSDNAHAKAVADVAREKFWGRVAVLALGVRTVPQGPLLWRSFGFRIARCLLLLSNLPSKAMRQDLPCLGKI